VVGAENGHLPSSVPVASAVTACQSGISNARSHLSRSLILRSLSSGLVKGGARIERCGAAQIAGVSIIMRASPMHRAAGVPNHEIARPPLIAVDEFRPSRLKGKVVQ